jgi:Mn-dependent DtxR family transcriptional regulator
MMTRISKMLGVRGTTLKEVHDTLLSEGVSEYDIFLTCKGAAIIYPHVADVLAEESIPNTEPQT